MCLLIHGSPGHYAALKMSNPSQEAVPIPTWPSLLQWRQCFHSHLSEMRSLLQGQLGFFFFGLHYSCSNTLYVLPTAKEAVTASFYTCPLSHNNKQSLTLYRNELNDLFKKSIPTVLWANQWKRWSILTNKEYIYSIVLPTSLHSNNHIGTWSWKDVAPFFKHPIRMPVGASFFWYKSATEYIAKLEAEAKWFGGNIFQERGEH